MANPFKKIEDTHTFNWQEIATALVKQKGLSVGLWRVGLEFDLRAANVNVGTGFQVPAAFLPVLRMNIRQVKELDDLTVDAAVVNPRPRILMPVN